MGYGAEVNGMQARAILVPMLERIRVNLRSLVIRRSVA